MNRITRQSAQNAVWDVGRLICLAPRLLDASSRSLPDFLIIGAMKAGTTSLYHVLGGHPQVMRSLYKEVHFFDLNYRKGVNWYRAHFPRRGRKQGANAITGECSPSYLFLPSVPELVKATVPDCRFIVVLRNPIDRAYSHYHHQVRLGKETLSFEEATRKERNSLESNPDLLVNGPADGFHTRPTISYLIRSVYPVQLCRWFALFPKERFLVLEYKETLEEMQPAMERICSYLRLRTWVPEQWERRNAGSYRNIAAATREELRRFFEPYNASLETMLGRSFDWT